MPDQSYLMVDGVSKLFGNPGHAVAALDHVSFTLEKGRFLSILGPSGCGKTTLFNIIAGLLEPDTGTVTLNCESLILHPGMTGYMLQRDLLLPWRTIADNITLPLTLRGMHKHAALSAAMTDARSCGLEPLLHRKPDQLSGGQRQRAALVRTLQTGKELLLLDEPFGALDAITRLHLQELLTELCLQKGLTVLFVTHDVDEALLLSDRIIVMTERPGTVLEQLAVPLPHPRTPESLADPEMAALKARLMRLLWQESSPIKEANA